jgi:hypothetical protein
LDSTFSVWGRHRFSEAKVALTFSDPERSLAQPPSAPSPAARMWSYRFLFVGFFILACALFLLCLTPPVSRDALIHHLTLPKLYLKHGGMVELPHLFFSYFPGNLQLLYMIPLYFGNDIFPKLIHWAFGVGTALLILFYLRRKTGPHLALLGALFFLSIPAIVRLAISAYVDLGLVFFSTASLLLFLRWTENGGIDRYFLGSAIFAGLALGTKYNALILLFVMACFVAWASARRRAGQPHASARAAGFGLLFVSVSLAIFSPWLIRNYVWTQNPFYPLFQSVFSSSQEDSSSGGKEVSAEISVKMSSLAYRRTIHQESWAEILLLPVRLFFQGEDNNARLFDGRLNPGLLILPFFAFWPVFLWKNQNHARWMASFSLLIFCYTIFSTVLRVRYLAPILPPLVILAMIGLHNLWNRVRVVPSAGMRKTGMGILFIGVGLMLAWNAGYIFGQFARVRPLSYLSGEVSRDEYIQARRPGYSAMQFINRNLSKDSRVLLVFTGRQGYYLDRDFRLDYRGGGRSFLLNAVRSTSSAEEAYTRFFRSEGLTHLLVRISMFQRWLAEDLDPASRFRVQAFLRDQTSLLFSQDGYAVFQLNGNR